MDAPSFSDIRVLVNADADLQAGIKTAVRSYNTDQFICATVDGKSVCVCGR